MSLLALTHLDISTLPPEPTSASPAPCRFLMFVALNGGWVILPLHRAVAPGRGGGVGGVGVLGC